MTIQFEQLSKYYVESRALKDATGIITAGEKVLISGENGSGKSTLLKILSGQILATSGSIYIRGEKLCKDHKKQFSILGEEKFLYLDLSIRENFSLFLSTYQEGQIAKELSMKLQLKESDKRPIRELSSGQRQKVTIVRALAKNAQILFFDEPLNFLDIESKETVAKLINDTDKSVILVSHETSYFPKFKQVTIRDGVLTC